MPLPNAARAGATVFIFVTVLIDMLTFGMIGPVLPKLIAGFVGNDYAHAAEVIGLFATAWAAMQFFCSPLLGMISDRDRPPTRHLDLQCRHRRRLRDHGARAESLVALCGPRAFRDRDREYDATASAYIADVTPPEKRAAAFGMIGSAFGLGFVLGPAIGGAVGTIDPRLTFWAAAGFALLNTLYGLFVLPESLPRERRTARLEWKRANPLGSLAPITLPSRTVGPDLGESHHLHGARGLSEYLGDLLHRRLRLEHRQHRTDACARRHRCCDQSGDDGRAASSRGSANGGRCLRASWSR